jgi:hypothetical protein
VAIVNEVVVDEEDVPVAVELDGGLRVNSLR